MTGDDTAGPSPTGRRDADELAQAAIDAMPAHICVLDQTARVIAVNRAWREFARANDAPADYDGIGSNYLDICAAAAGDDAAQAHEFAAGLRRVLAGELPSFELEYPCRERHRTRWFRAAVSAFQAGRQRHLLVQHHDITDATLAERELRESLQKYYDVVEKVRDGIFLAQEHRFVFVNPAFAEMLGYAAQDMIGLPFEALIAPQDLALWCDRFERRIAGLAPLAEYQLTMLHRNGTPLRMELRASLSLFDERPAVLGAVHDITRRTQAEDLMRQAILAAEHSERTKSELLEKLNEAQTCARIGSWSVALASGEIWWSDELYRILEVSPDTYQPDAKHNERFVHPDDLDAYLLEVYRAFRERGRLDCTIRIRAANGALKFCRSRGQVAYDAEGLPVRYFGTLQDVTEQHQLEQEQMRLRAQLLQAQKMQAIGQLTGGIAHDFYNILGSIIGYSTLALDRYAGADSGKLAEYLREVLRASNRARDLVAKMMAFSRSQPEDEVAAVCEPQAVIRDAVQMLRSVVPSSVAIELALDPGVPAIRIDAVELHQMLVNLVINARDAIDTPGHIRIELSAEAPVAAVCTACHRNVAGNFVSLTVSDTGHGIAPEQMNLIFEPFFTTKCVDQGTGLGLSVVHGVMHKLGGHVLVHSVPGKGARIELLFVRARQSPAIPAPPQVLTRQAPQARRDTHVMIVDDEPALARLWCEILEQGGLRASAFTDPRAALAAFEAEPNSYDIVFTDQTMPGMTGDKLAQALLARRPDLPVVLCTGYSARLDTDSARATGVACFLRKPVQADELLAAIERLCPAQPAMKKGEGAAEQSPD